MTYSTVRLRDFGLLHIVGMGHATLRTLCGRYYAGYVWSMENWELGPRCSICERIYSRLEANMRCPRCDGTMLPDMGPGETYCFQCGYVHIRGQMYAARPGLHNQEFTPQRPNEKHSKQEVSDE